MEHSAIAPAGMGSARGFLFDQQHTGVRPTSTEFPGDAQADHPTPNDEKITGLHVVRRFSRWMRGARRDAQSICRVSTDSLRISTIFFNSSVDVDNGGMRTSTFPMGLKISPFVRAIDATRWPALTLSG
jgi:hypothetical protein